MTVSSRKHATTGRAGAGGNAQDKAGVRKVGLLSSPLLLLASMVFFSAPKKMRLKEKSFSNEGGPASGACGGGNSEVN